MGKTSAVWLSGGVAATVLVALLVHPALDSGFNDDWCYVRMAQRFAATGHITYDGWTQPMSVPVTLWGALLIRLFGFSYFVLRLSMLPFWVGSVVLVWLIGRRIGLPPALASLVSLSVALSPTAIPLGTSFTTDVPAAMFTLLAAYCAMRGVTAQRPAISIAWLCGVSAAGILAGMNRQVFWAAAPLMIAGVACFRWRERSFRAPAAAALVATLAISALCMKWQAAQPGYRQNTFELAYAHGLGIPKQLAAEGVQIGRTLLLLMLPVLILFLARAGALRRKILLVAAGCLILPVALACYRPHAMQAPWLGNLFTAFGPLRPYEDTWGSKPLVIPVGIQILLGLVVCASTAAALAFAWERLHSYKDSLRRMWAAAWEKRSPILVFALTTGPLVLLYTGLLVARSLSAPNFDRYVAAIIGFPALLVGWFWREISPGRGGAAAGWIVVALFAAFGAAATHDIFATDRARLAAADWVTQHDVPRRCLTAGYEYDGETQLFAQGTLVDERTPDLKTRPIDFWFFEWTPAIQPCMYVVLSQEPKLGPVETRVDYQTWLMPQRRQILVQRGPGPCPASCTRNDRASAARE